MHKLGIANLYTLTIGIFYGKPPATITGRKARQGDPTACHTSRDTMPLSAYISPVTAFLGSALCPYIPHRKNRSEGREMASELNSHRTLSEAAQGPLVYGNGRT